MSNRLRELRVAKGLSLEALAVLVKTSAQQLSRLENGPPKGRKLTKEWAIRIAPSLDTTWEVILGAANPGFAEPVEASPAAAPADREHRDEEFADISEAVSDMLKAASMPTDQRTVARLALQVERELRVLDGRLPFQERLELTISETRSRLQRKWEDALRTRR